MTPGVIRCGTGSDVEHPTLFGMQLQGRPLDANYVDNDILMPGRARAHTHTHTHTDTRTRRCRRRHERTAVPPQTLFFGLVAAEITQAVQVPSIAQHVEIGG